MKITDFNFWVKIYALVAIIEDFASQKIESRVLIPMVIITTINQPPILQLSSILIVSGTGGITGLSWTILELDTGSSSLLELTGISELEEERIDLALKSKLKTSGSISFEGNGHVQEIKSAEDAI